MKKKHLIPVLLTILLLAFIGTSLYLRVWWPAPIVPIAPSGSAPLPPQQSNSTQVESPLVYTPPPATQPTEIPESPTAPVTVSTGFDSSFPYPVAKLSPSHFTIDFGKKPANFFLLKIENAKGRTIRFDLLNAPNYKWSTFNPVYTYASDLNSLATYSRGPLTASTKSNAALAKNGAKLPDTSDQLWHYIPEVWSEPKRISFTHTFTQDSAFVAMRVPYTPQYNEAYLRQLAKLHPKLIKLHEVGKSKAGQTLFIVEVAGNSDQKFKNPCTLIYAREHATEHDTSWVAQGMLEFITESPALIQSNSFLVIPLLDPDGALEGAPSEILESFVAGRETVESKAYAAFLRKWVDDAHRLDFFHNLRNVESQESPHLACAMIEPASGRQQICLDFHQTVQDQFRGSSFRVNPTPWYKTYTAFRFGGYLQSYYGTLHIPYEVNSQERHSHLNLQGLRDLGELLLDTTITFLASEKAKPLLASIDDKRRQRTALWIEYAEILHKNTAFDNALWMESAARDMPTLEKLRNNSPTPPPPLPQ